MSPARLAAALLAATVPGLCRRLIQVRLRRWSGRPGCVLFDSGRAALRWLLTASGAGPGVEVLLSTFTCPAVIDAVLATGARPVLLDFDSNTGPQLAGVALKDRIVVLTDGLGIDEFALSRDQIVEAGGRVVLDLAQAVPSAEVLRRYRAGDCPLVLSFGEGKALGGIGGGAALLLRSGPFGQVPPPGAGSGGALRRLAAEWLLQWGPARLRRRSTDRQRRAAWWSETRADHLPEQAEQIRLAGPSRWQLATTAVMLLGANRLRTRLVANHRLLAAALSGTTLGLVAAPGDLAAGLEFRLPEPYQRYRVAKVLAERGIPTTWNYYPLHLQRPYRGYAPSPLPAAETLWTRVLTVPKQPQRRLRPGVLIEALRQAERCLFEPGSDRRPA